MYAVSPLIGIYDFWEMTIAEWKMVSDKWIEKKKADEKNQKMIIYNQAALIASFVGCVFDGKPLPSYNDVFDPQQAMIDKFKAYVNELNSRRK